MEAASTPFAFVTLVTSDSYSPGALTLAAALREVHLASHTPFHILCLVTPETVDVSTIKLLRTSFDAVIGVEVIAQHDRTGLDLLGRPDLDTALTKLHIFRLVQYQKIIYLDADVLPIKPLSHLFHIEHEFSAAPDVGWPDIFNSGVLVFSPGHDKFNELQEIFKEKGSWDGADQGLLNEWRGDNWNRLSFTYNTTPTAAYTYAPAYARFGSQISALHFIGPNKPWKEIPYRTPGINTAATPSGAPPTDAPPHQSYDYASLVDRWFSVYDRHFRAPSREPGSEFGIRRYASAWESIPSGSDGRLAKRLVVPPPDSLGLEELKRLALEGVASLGNQPIGEDSDSDMGVYFSLPLEGRVDLMRPLLQLSSPSPHQSNRDNQGLQPFHRPHLLPSPDPSDVPPSSESSLHQPAPQTPYQTTSTQQRHPYHNQQIAPERHHLSTLHDTPFIDHRWEQQNAKQQHIHHHHHTSSAAATTQYSRRHDTPHRPSTHTAERDHRADTHPHRRQTPHSTRQSSHITRQTSQTSRHTPHITHRDPDHHNLAQNSPMGIRGESYRTEFQPQQQQAQISHTRYHDFTQHQIARKQGLQYTSAQEPRYGNTNKLQRQPLSETRASLPRTSSPPLLIWNPAFDPPPSDPPVLPAFPKDSYYENVWDQPYGRELEEQHRYFDQQHTGPLPTPQSEAFFEPPPPPHIPSSLLSQGQYRNITGDTDTPVPDPSKVRSIFTWENDPQHKHPPKRVFPMSESLTKIPNVAEAMTVPPPPIHATIPPAVSPPKISPLVTPSLIYGPPEKLSYVNAWDVVPSIKKYAARLIKPPRSSAPEDWRRHSGGSWDDRAEEGSRDGDVEDEGDDDDEPSEGEPEPDSEPKSEDETPEVKAWRRRHSFIGREKTYRVRGVQTIPRETREMAAQTTHTLKPLQPTQPSSLPSKADTATDALVEQQSPLIGLSTSASKENDRNAASRAVSPDKTSHSTLSTAPKEKMREAEKQAQRPILTLAKPMSPPSAMQRERSGETSTPSSTGPVSPKEGQPLAGLAGESSRLRLPRSSSLSAGSPLSPAPRKASRVWDPARGVDVFKRGSEEVLAKFLRMGSFDSNLNKT